MLTTYLPSSICLSIWCVALNYVFPWKRKIKIPHLLKIKESSVSDGPPVGLTIVHNKTYRFLGVLNFCITINLLTNALAITHTQRQDKIR